MEEPIKLLFEPIIKKKTFFRKDISFRRIKPAITESMITNTFNIRIENQSCVTIEDLFLEEIEIHSSVVFYSRTFGDSSNIGQLKPGQVKKIKFGTIIFPVAGLYWLDVDVRFKEMNNYDIELKQRALEGRIADGHVEGEIYVCRNPIGVVDNLSAKMRVYSMIILLLTILTVGITLYQWLQ